MGVLFVDDNLKGSQSREDGPLSESNQVHRLRDQAA